MLAQPMLIKHPNIAAFSIIMHVLVGTKPTSEQAAMLAEKIVFHSSASTQVGYLVSFHTMVHYPMPKLTFPLYGIEAE